LLLLLPYLLWGIGLDLGFLLGGSLFLSDQVTLFGSDFKLALPFYITSIMPYSSQKLGEDISIVNVNGEMDEIT
jgi:hypothetical protein